MNAVRINKWNKLLFTILCRFWFRVYINTRSRLFARKLFRSFSLLTTRFSAFLFRQVVGFFKVSVEEIKEHRREHLKWERWRRMEGKKKLMLKRYRKVALRADDISTWWIVLRLNHPFSVFYHFSRLHRLGLFAFRPLSRSEAEGFLLFKQKKWR